MPSGLSFITSNPTTEAFRAGMESRQKRRANEEVMRKAEADADVAQSTVQPRIQDASNLARISSVNAGVTERGALDAVAINAANARTAVANADEAKAKAAQAKAWIQEKSIELALEDLDLAVAWAAQNGEPMSEKLTQILRNPQVVKALGPLMKVAKEFYPGDHNADIRSKEVKRIMTNAATSGDRVNQAAVSRELVSPEAPDARATSIYGKSGAPGGKLSVYEMKRQAWLSLHPNDQAGALEYAGGRSTMNDRELHVAVYRLATEEGVKQVPAWTSEQIDARAQELLQLFRGQTSGVPQASVGTPAVPAPRDPAEREVGKVYVSPNGRKGQWTGTAWRPVN